MKPTKEGQIVKFHTPLQDEDPNTQYVILEITSGLEKNRAQIQALGTGLPFPPVNTVMVDDLEVVEVDTSDLIGYEVTIQKPDFSEVKGKVINVSTQSINLDLTNGTNGVETNVWVTIIDIEGNEHSGTLLVN